MAPPVFYKVLYGNAKPKPWQEKRTTVRPAILHRYRRQRVQGAPFPAITPHPSANVRGMLVTELSDADITTLDRFEGLGVLYDRHKVKVRLLKKSVGVRDRIADADLAQMEHGEVETEAYVWRNPEGLEDEEWDYEDFMHRKMRGWMGDMGSSGDYVGEVDDGFAAADSARAVRPGCLAGNGGRETTSSRDSSASPGAGAGRGRHAGPGASGVPGPSPHRSAKAGLGESGNLGLGARPSGADSPKTNRGPCGDHGPNLGPGAGKGQESTGSRGISSAQRPSRTRATMFDPRVSSGQGGTHGQGGSKSQEAGGSQGATGGRGGGRQIPKRWEPLAVDMEDLRRRSKVGQPPRAGRSDGLMANQAEMASM